MYPLRVWQWNVMSHANRMPDPVVAIQQWSTQINLTAMCSQQNCLLIVTKGWRPSKGHEIVSHSGGRVDSYDISSHEGVF